MPAYGVHCKVCGWRGFLHAGDRRMLELGISSLDRCPGGHTLANSKEDYEVTSWTNDSGSQPAESAGVPGNGAKVRRSKRS